MAEPSDNGVCEGQSLDVNRLSGARRVFYEAGCLSQTINGLFLFCSSRFVLEAVAFKNHQAQEGNQTAGNI